jgi:hypothetical protein
VIITRANIGRLRRLGITVIFLPEPFTTPVGVALVLVSRYLSRRLEAKMNERLRDALKYYVAHTRVSSYTSDGKSGGSGCVKRGIGDEERLFGGHHQCGWSFEAYAGQSAGQRRREACESRPRNVTHIQNISWHYGMGDEWKDKAGDSQLGPRPGTTEKSIHHNIDMERLRWRYKPADSHRLESPSSDTSVREEKVLHHTINIEWLSRYWEDGSSAVTHPGQGRTSRAVVGMESQSPDMALASQRYKAGSVGQAEMEYHTINMELLLERYRSAATVNFYKDVHA